MIKNYIIQYIISIITISSLLWYNNLYAQVPISDDDKTLIQTVSQRFATQAKQTSSPYDTLTNTINRLTKLLSHNIIRRNSRFKRVIESIISEISIIRQSYIHNNTLSSGSISLQQQLLQLVNLQRKQLWLTWLSLDDRLSLAAQRHAEYMAATDDFDHITRAGSEPRDRADAVGYPRTTIAENIGRCSLIWSPCDTSEAMMDQRMASPWHRANILDPDVTELGIGYHNGYRVQLFGAK